MTDDDNPEIEIVTPTFDRYDGVDVADCPDTAEEIEALAGADTDTLKEMGLRPWDGELYLLPAEWYDDIPDGTELKSILEEEVVFSHGDTDNDRRRGVLSYGVEVEE